MQMQTKRNIRKIQALKPTNALLKSKKGIGGPIVLIFAAIGVGVLGYGAYKHFTGDDAGDAKQLSVTTPDGDKTIVIDTDQKEALSCDGIASVNALLDDLNFYKIGTDPASHLSIYEKNGDDFKKVVADDATSTSVPVLSSFKGLAGNNIGTPKAGYFAEEVEFSSVCSDVDIQPKLRPSSAPTITVVNDNGITANSDSNHETVAASSTYTPCFTVKAAAESCGSRYGSVVIFEYDASYITKIDSSDLSGSGSGFFFPHTTNHSASGLDMDQYKVMKYEGMLCDGDKTEVCFDVTTGSSNPGEDQGNVRIHWRPINKDIDADEYTLITGIYDEDNNDITTANTTATWYVV